MRWSDERYVKLYTRDTADWLCLSWRAQGLLCLLLRKCDGAGLIFLGRHGKRAVATLIGAPWEPEIEAALSELLEDGCVADEGSYLIVRNFVEAQEARASDRVRKAHEREVAKAKVVKSARTLSTDVTRGHTESRGVTSCPTQTSSAQPIEKTADSLTLVPPSPETKPAPKSKPAADPQRRELSDALVAAFTEERGGGYGFDGVKDAEGVKRLLVFSRDVADHVRRWRLALNAPAGNYSYRVDTIAAFATGRVWNHFPPVEGATPAKKLYPGIPEYR